MYIDAKAKVGPFATTVVIRRDNHKQVQDCYAANTDEGWFDVYRRDPVSGRIMVDAQRQLVWDRIYDVSFDLVDKETGKILDGTLI